MSYITVKLTVKGGSGKVLKRSMAGELELSRKMETGTVDAYMRQIPKSYFDPIRNAGQNIRNLFKKFGIPVGGMYLIPIGQVASFENLLAKAMQEQSLAVDYLARSIADGSLVEQVRVMQGKEFNGTVPTVDQVRNAYAVIVDRKADVNDPIVAKALSMMDEKVAENLRREIQATLERENAERQDGATGKIVGEISKLMDDLSSAVDGDGKGRHFKTMVERIGRVINVLPQYNLYGDKQADALIDAVKVKLGEVKEWALKEDATVRTTVRTNVNSIKTEFAGLFKTAKTEEADGGEEGDDAADKIEATATPKVEVKVVEKTAKAKPKAKAKVAAKAKAKPKAKVNTAKAKALLA